MLKYYNYYGAVNVTIQVIDKFYVHYCNEIQT